MQPFQAVPAAPHFTGGPGAVLKSAVDEICATLARLIAYLCALALMFIVGVYLWDQLPEMHGEASAHPDWTVATRSIPAFASNQYDLLYKSKSYQILRHPEGGRKDMLRWNAENGRPVAGVEIYRPGGESEPSVAADTAGIVDSKFGPVTLLKPHGRPLPRLPEGHRAAGVANFRLCLPGRDSTGPRGCDRLPAQPAEPDFRRQRCQACRTVRPRRLEAGRLPHRLDIGLRQAFLARRDLSAGPSAKPLVFM